MIYIHKDNRELGPFDEAEIRRHWANGVISSKDMAWHPGLDEWIPVKNLFGVPRPAEDLESRHIPAK